MDSKYNMDLLFNTSFNIDYKGKDIFKKASFLYEFDIDHDFNDYSEEDRRLLEENSFLKPDGKRRLSREDRTEILADRIGKENIVEHIEKYGIKTDFSNLLLMLSTKESIDLSKLSDDELYYVTTVGSYFPEKVDVDLAQDLYQRRQFFAQFERITNNFAGRKDELKKIDNYVDWLPKTNFLDKLTSSFKNVIGWHDKPPLLIKGIGGIGKSTLVAKFILNQNHQVDGKNLPFVYIDFDLQGFSITEPMTILLEALRQISIQFPASQQIVDEVREQISGMITGKDGKRSKEKSSSSVRGLVYNSIREIIEGYNVEISNFNDRPILVVFDSFEEMQYRASSEELFSFFAFIKEVSELIPRVRPIFAGRAEIDESFVNFKFENLPILDFDEASANVLLENYGVSDQAIRTFIYKNFGGVPLMLRLAADVANKEGFKIENKDEIIGKKWEYLVTRIQGHIHNEKVGKIAIPGMLVRHISPEIIQQVLAGPTKIGKLSNDEAQSIYNELVKEVALISKIEGNNIFSFRQDLRMTCEDMIIEKYKEDAHEIHNLAIAYYSKYKNIVEQPKRNQYKAEYYFHQLKQEKIPEDLNIETYNELRPFLEQSIIELPEKSQLFIKSLTKNQVTKQVIKESADEDWENYYIGQIKDGLRGELQFLENIYKALQKRKARVNDGFTEMGYHEALLNQRLDKLNDSRKMVDKALNSSIALKGDNRPLSILFHMLQIQNYEYEEKYVEALKVIEQLKAQTRLESNDKIKLEFLENRIHARVNSGSNPENLLIKGSEGFRTKEGELDIKWNFIFNQMDWSASHFKSREEIKGLYKERSKSFKQPHELERMAYDQLGFYMKEITLTGKLNILIWDYVFIEELIKVSS